MPAQGPWNSLEIVKLIVAGLTPIAVVALGVYVHRLTKRFEHSQWRNQKLIEKRLMVYEELASGLNDNLCYFTYVGNWKTRTPPEVIASKRILDKKIYLAQPLFSEAFFSACMRFQNLCFEQFTGWGMDAKLKTQFGRRQEACGVDWQQEWEECFSEGTSDPKEVRWAYQQIMTRFTEEIGISDGQTHHRLGRVPANIR